MVGTADELSEEDRAWLATYVLLESAGHVNVKTDEREEWSVDHLYPETIRRKWSKSSERGRVSIGCNRTLTGKRDYEIAAKIFFAKSYCHE